MRVENPAYDSNGRLDDCNNCPLYELELKYCFKFNCPTANTYQDAIKLAEEVTNG